MKAFLSLAAIAAGLAVTNAITCTDEGTKAVASTGPVDYHTVSNGMEITSIYNGTTSVMAVTGNLTNPFVSTATAVVTVYEYVTVALTTCTVGSKCTVPLITPNSSTSFVGGPVTSIVGTGTHTKTNDTPGFVSATSTAVHTAAPNITAFATYSTITSATTSLDPSIPISVNITSWSYITRFITLTVTAPATSTTVTSDCDDIISTSRSTVTVLPLPAKQVSAAPFPRLNQTAAATSSPSRSVTVAQANATWSLGKMPPTPPLTTTTSTVQSTAGGSSQSTSTSSTGTMVVFPLAAVLLALVLCGGLDVLV